MRSLLHTSLSVILALLVAPALAQTVTLSPPEGEFFPPAQIAASPANMTLDLNGQTTNGSIRVHNLGDRPVNIHTGVSHFQLDEDNRVEEIPPTAQSLDQWIIINPVDFSIAAGEQQVVRFSVRPRTKPTPGEHRAMVFFEEVPDPSAISEGVKVNFRLGVALYGTVGEVVSKGLLHSLKMNRVGDLIEIGADIESQGNALVRLGGQYSIWPRGQIPEPENIREYNLTEKGWDVPDTAIGAGPLPSTPVLPGTRRTVKFSFTPPQAAGDYLVAIHGRLGDVPVAETIALTIR